MNVECLRAWHWGWLRDDLNRRGVPMSMASCWGWLKNDLDQRGVPMSMALGVA